MEGYVVYYFRAMPRYDQVGAFSKELLAVTHRPVRVLAVEPGLENVFLQMQGEVWSPRGEAREMLEALGIRHTSMSIGDVVYSVGAKTYYVCLDSGWAELPEKPDEVELDSYCHDLIRISVSTDDASYSRMSYEIWKERNRDVRK